MRVQVTGAHGFIGQHVVSALEAAGHVVNKDLQIDALIHLKAFANLAGCEADPKRAVYENVAQTHEVVQHARQRGAAVFVYASTTSIYEAGMVASDGDVRDRPLSVYAATKLCGEVVGRMAAPGASFTILRMPNVYGPGQFPQQRGVVPNWLGALRAGETMKAHVGALASVRDYCYVADVAQWYVRALEGKLPHRPGVTMSTDPWIMATGVMTTGFELAAAVAKAWGNAAPVIEQINGISPRHPHHHGYIPDLVCTTTLADGLAKTVADWRGSRSDEYTREHGDRQASTAK